MLAAFGGAAAEVTDDAVVLDKLTFVDDVTNKTVDGRVASADAARDRRAAQPLRVVRAVPDPER